jgi:hypothetical protein
MADPVNPQLADKMPSATQCHVAPGDIWNEKTSSNAFSDKAKIERRRNSTRFLENYGTMFTTFCRFLSDLTINTSLAFTNY